MNADASKTTEPGRGSFPGARRASLARLVHGEPGVERVAGVRAPGVVDARARGVRFHVDVDGGGGGGGGGGGVVVVLLLVVVVVGGGVSSTTVSYPSSSSDASAAAACPISSHIAADAESRVARPSSASFEVTVASLCTAFAAASRALASLRRRQLLGRIGLERGGDAIVASCGAGPPEPETSASDDSATSATESSELVPVARFRLDRAA